MPIWLARSIVALVSLFALGLMIALGMTLKAHLPIWNAEYGSLTVVVIIASAILVLVGVTYLVEAGLQRRKRER